MNVFKKLRSLELGIAGRACELIIIYFFYKNSKQYFSRIYLARLLYIGSFFVGFLSTELKVVTHNLGHWG